MAKHDWNMPCDCSDCCEIIQTHVCPSCQFPNKVSIDRIAHWEEDRKTGGGGFIFEVPSGPIRDLNCYSCANHMKAVGYYTSVHERFCQKEKERIDLIRSNKICACCSKVEGIDWGFSGRVQLREYGGRQLCESCLIDTVKLENPDPSDKDNKYKFDRNMLDWILDRIRIPCVTCGKGHLVAVREQSWRTRCKSCYSRRQGSTLRGG